MKIGALRTLIVGFATMVAATHATAHPPSVTDQGTSKPVFTFYPEKLRGICNDVYGKIEDKTKPNEWSYAYERKVYEAANVDFGRDTPQTARLKIRTLWANFQTHFKCDGGDFNVSRGSILKYAVVTKAFSLLDNAMRVWGIDLNIVDESDRKTLLDFVADRVAESGGTDVQAVLTDYQTTLQKYGAKHCRDLPDRSKCK